MGINNIKHNLNCIARRMEAWADDPMTDDDAERKRIVIKQDAQSLREYVLTLKDPDLYIGDRLKAAIVLGQVRLCAEDPSDIAKRFASDDATPEDRDRYQVLLRYRSLLTSEELGWLRLKEARELHWHQARADWATSSKAVADWESREPYPKCEDYGLVDCPEYALLAAMYHWVSGGEVGPRPQKSDFGL